MNWRIERDSLGEVRVPKSAYWGAATQRAVENFPISGTRLPRRFIGALGVVKRACAMANEALGLLPVDKGEWIAAAAQEVVDGRFDAQFPVDVFQTGSGTSTNMNANEVIANRAIEMMGGVIGSGAPVHPNDHVNLGQSSNDVIPTTIHVSAAVAIHEDLLPALTTLAAALRRKAQEFDGIVKSGRTHLVDATPVRLGQEFGGYAAMVEQAGARASAARDALLPLALGGTAVGTGVNRHPEFPGRAIAHIAAITRLSFREAADHFAAQGTLDAAVEASGLLRAVALSLHKIANDLRWMASGPESGLGELKLPPLQPGSSIMPGKVNPVLAEVVMMVASDVVGNDAAIAFAATSANFELHTAQPLVADRLLRSIAILSSSARVFADRCVVGITADAARCAESLAHNPALATALAPEIGYDRAAEIVKAAVASGRTISEVAAERSGLSAERLVELLDPRRLTQPG